MRTLICGGLSLALLCGTAMAQGAQPSPGGTDDRTATPFVTEQQGGSGAADATRTGSDRPDRDRKDRDDDRKDRKWDDDDRKDDWRGHGDRRGPDGRHERMRDRDDRGPHHDRKGDRDERGPKHHMGPDGKGPMGPHHGWMGGPGPSGDDGAAHFRFDRGGRGGSIDIKCAADETTQECVDAIMPLMEAIMDARGRD